MAFGECWPPPDDASELRIACEWYKLEYKPISVIVASCWL